jgi:thioredoxin-like negative regulator of GroEL
MQSIDRDADIRRSDDLAARALAADPSSYHAHHAKARVLVAQKRADEALTRRMAYSDNPSYLAFRERIYQGLSKAGMPEA